MYKVKITVMRKVSHDDLIKKYENPLEHACDVKIEDVFIVEGIEKPRFCTSAHDSFAPFVLSLSFGAGDFYDADGK